MHESFDEFEFQQICNRVTEKTNRPIKPKFCIHVIIDKIYVVICKSLIFFANLQQSYGP